MPNKSTESKVVTFRRTDPAFSEWFAYSKAHASEVCRRIVSREFIGSSKRSALAVMVAFRRRPGGPQVTHKVYPQERRFDKPGLRILGFAILQQKRSYRGAKATPHLYISSVCARGYGTKLLLAAERFGREQGFHWIALAALNHVISYYHTKLAYRFYDSLADDAAPNPVVESAYAVASGDNKNTFQNTFLRVLIRQKFAYDRQCRVPRTCNANGYWMAKRL